MNTNGNITLALIAHDHRKEALADFVLEHREALKRFNLVATAGSGSIVKRRTGLPVRLLEAGPLGGDRQLGEITADNEVQAVIFFRDPVGADQHEPDFADLLRVCDLQEIPLATNPASAEALLYFLMHSPDCAAIVARPWGFVVPA
jgi:methylglyoxal synthase